LPGITHFLEVVAMPVRPLQVVFSRFFILEEPNMKIYSTILAMILAAVPATVMAQAPIIIKFSHVVATDTPKGKAAEFFAKRAG
jgi:hypothetical protein